MNKIKFKNYFIVIALLLLLTIAFDYAYLNTTLTINGTSTIKKIHGMYILIILKFKIKV